MTTRTKRTAMKKTTEKKTPAAPPARHRDPRTLRFQIRCTTADKEAWDNAAAQLGIDTSDLIRMAMAKQLGIKAKIRPTGAAVVTEPRAAA